MKDIIHVHIYEPHKGSLFGNTKNDRSELHIYRCEKAGECETYKNGMCVNVSNPLGARCPHGKRSVSKGFTQRAQKYYKQINEWKETYADTYHKLNTAPERVVKVAGGWMLPYAHIHMNKDLPFCGAGYITGTPFLKEEDFTKELFIKLINQRPQSLMGGEITSYQKEQVPKFIKDLHDHYPEKFTEVADEHAWSVVANYDCVGRKVFLKTVTPNVEVVISKKTWWWDGKTISRKNQDTMIFKPVSWVSNYIEFTPDDNATIVVTDNNQVNKTTVLAD